MVTTMMSPNQQQNNQGMVMQGNAYQQMGQAMPYNQMPGSQTAGPQAASLYVGDLIETTTEKELHEHFSSMGPLASIRLCRDSVTRKSLGYAYVNFLNQDDASRALKEKNFTDIAGKECRIMWAQRDPSSRKSNDCNVFVKNLDKSIDNKALYETFSLFGDILSCKISVDDKGRSLGYGFVNFADKDTAREAMERVDGMKIGSKNVVCCPFKPRDQRDSPDPEQVFFTNLYVKNFPGDWSEGDIRRLFEAHGVITSMEIKKDFKERAFAFVNFENVDSAKAAVDELNGQDLRTDEEKEQHEKDNAALKEQGQPEAEPLVLYVGRAMTKFERSRMLKQEYEKSKSPGTKIAEGTAPGKSASAERQFPGVNLYVRNVAENITDEDLKKLFTPYGEVGSAKVMTDGEGKSKGFGFVTLLDEKMSKKALNEMNNKIVNGKPLYVRLAERKEDRSARLTNHFIQQQAQQTQPNSGPGNMMGNMHPMQMNPMTQGNPMQNMMMMQNMQQGMPMQMQGHPQMHPMQMQNMRQGGGPNGNMNGQHGGPGPRGPMNQMGNHGPQGNHMNRGPHGGNMGHNQNHQQNRGMPNFTQNARNQQNMSTQMNMNKQTMGNHQNSANPQQQQTNFNPSAPLTAASLAAAPPGMQKQMLGEKLFPAIAHHQPELAGKITGMMLEMDNSELLILLESTSQMKIKVDEALRVLDNQKQ